jgi:hypothetical protein
MSTGGQLLRDIYAGGGQIISHPGTSQYSQGSNSGCGLAAFNCTRTLLGMEKAGFQVEDIFHAIEDRATMDVSAPTLTVGMSSHFFQDIVSICAVANIPNHMEVEDYQSLPLFEATLQHELVEYCSATNEKIFALLRYIQPLFLNIWL